MHLAITKTETVYEPGSSCFGISKSVLK